MDTQLSTYGPHLYTQNKKLACIAIRIVNKFAILIVTAARFIHENSSHCRPALD
jgi:hypothetical protein